MWKRAGVGAVVMAAVVVAPSVPSTTVAPAGAAFVQPTLGYAFGYSSFFCDHPDCSPAEVPFSSNETSGDVDYDLNAPDEGNGFSMALSVDQDVTFSPAAAPFDSITITGAVEVTATAPQENNSKVYGDVGAAFGFTSTTAFTYDITLSGCGTAKLVQGDTVFDTTGSCGGSISGTLPAGSVALLYQRDFDTDGELGSLALSATIESSACTILGDDDPETLNGTGGDDVICGMGGVDTIDGKGGNDTILGGTGDDVVIGGPGDDLLIGCIGNDTFDGGAGDDEIRGGYPRGTEPTDGCASKPTNDGRDKVVGGADDDTIDTGPQDDLVIGGAGDDTIRPGGGNDVVSAGDGDDLVVDDRGRDRLAGCAGDDTLRGGDDTDLLATGKPLPNFFPASGMVVRGVDARVCSQDATTARNSANGGPGDDELIGDRGLDTLLGERGVDAINGQAGNDVLKGGSENDTLRLGPGRDTADGDGGADTFFAVDDTRDTVNGGPGRDTATLDRADVRTSIERVR